MIIRRHAIAIRRRARGACRAAAPALAQEKLKVLATFSILGDFVKNVGGDRVEVTTLVGPNSDAHVYSPAPADAKKVAAAKVVITNGLGFEGWMARLVQGVRHARRRRSSPPRASSRASRPAHGHSHGHGDDRSACLAVGRECQDLRRQYPRRADRRRSGRQGGLRGQRRGLSRQARRARQGGPGGGRRDPAGPAPDHHLARCLRLFPGTPTASSSSRRRACRRNRRRPRATSAASSRRSSGRRSRRCSWRTSPTRG